MSSTSYAIRLLCTGVSWHNNVSAANAGIGLGAMLGGLVIPLWGLGSIGYAATEVGILAVFMIA